MVETIQITYENLREYEQELFDILADNMTKIAPTGNSREEDFFLWSGILRERLLNRQCSIVAFLCVRKVVGYLQYSIRHDTFLIEELEIVPQFQVRYNILGRIIRLLSTIVPSNIVNVEAYTNANNHISIQILDKIGFKMVRANGSGTSYLYRGKYSALAKRFKL